MGARIRHLSKAPITEALIDFRVQPRDGMSPAELESLKSELASAGYPDSQPMRHFEAQLDFQNGNILSPPPSQRETGFLFPSRDRSSVVQARIDGFTFNRLPQYTSWDAIFPETIRLWHLYRQVAQPVQIVRLAVRYINRLGIPSPDYARYLSALPTIPSELPQHTRGFLTRVVLYDEPRDISATVTQVSETGVRELGVTVLLDIDAFKEVTSDLGDSQIEGVFESLHALKNEIFFGSITEDTARMYE